MFGFRDNLLNNDVNFAIRCGKLKPSSPIIYNGKQFNTLLN
jgi:hypothetical protein